MAHEIANRIPSLEFHRELQIQSGLNSIFYVLLFVMHNLFDLNFLLDI